MQFLAGHHDYIFLLQGFFVLCLGALTSISATGHQEEKPALATLLFSAYAVLHALALWMGFYSLTLQELGELAHLRELLFVASFSCLVLYGVAHFWKGAASIVAALLLSAVSVAVIGAWIPFKLSLCVLAVSGIALSCAAFWSNARQSAGGAHFLWMLLAVAHGAYGLACVLRPDETLWLASMAAGTSQGVVVSGAALLLIVIACVGAFGGVMSRHPALNAGLGFRAMALSVCAGFVCIAWLPPYEFKSYGLESLKEDCRFKATFINRNLKFGIEKGAELAAMASSAPWARDFFETPGPAARDRAFDGLRRYSSLIQGTVFYFLDNDGDCIMSSNRGSPESFENGNFAFRPYFKDALKHGYGMCLAVGAVSKRPGVFTARSVRSPDGRVLGVVAVNQNVGSIAGVQAGDIMAIVSPEGIIFDSNMPDMLFKTINKLGRERADALSFDLQFGPGPFPYLELDGPCLGRGDETCALPKKECWMQEPLPAAPGWTLLMRGGGGELVGVWLSGLGISMIGGLLLLSAVFFRAIRILNAARINSHLAWKIAILENSSAGVFVLDTERRIVEVNSTGAAMFGYRREEMEGMGAEGLYISRDDYQEKGRLHYASIAKDGKSVMEYELKRKDGERIWCKVSGMPLHCGERSKAYVWILTDETEKRSVLERLKESEALYRSLVQSSSEHVFMLDRQGCYLSSNNSAISSRIPAGGGRAAHLMDFHGKAVAKRYADMLEKVFMAGKPVTFQHAERKGDGLRHYINTLFPIMKDGAVRAVGGICKDISSMKRAEDSLRRSERRFKDIVESSSDMVWETDSKGRFIYYSEGVFALLGYSPSEILGRTPFDFMPPEESRRVADLFGMIKKELLPFRNLEHTILSKSGGTVWMSTSGVPVFDESGDFCGYRGTDTDITKAKEGEAGLLRARDEAEAATRTKSEFIAVMSHEVRTPMNGIMGMAELLLRTELSKEQRECVSTIAASGEHLLSILNDVLDQSKIEAGKVSLSLAPCSLFEICREVVAMLSPKAMEKGLRLELSYPSNAPACVMADARRLRQIFINLISNSIKFTESGSVSLSAEPLAIADASRCRLGFRVSDTGIGIPKEMQSGLFQKFSQIESVLADKHFGTGLGLSITKGLVELMGGGPMRLESEPGKGTDISFELEFPVAGVESLKSLAPPIPQSLDGILFNGRVLLVEDNLINMKVAVRFLEAAGCPADCAPDGETAVSMAREGGYSVILLDLHLPGMDGYRTAEAIREEEGRMKSPRTPIIALTANVMTDEGARCARAGMDGFLGKPLKSADLKLELSKWLPRRTPPA